ncbi:MAG: GDP-mannose 4,6-dehydratase [Patescibacteria group bacterium]
MKPIALITGITGQDGSYLAELLLRKNYQVVGLASSKFNIGDDNIKAIKSQLKLEVGDLLDEKSLQKIIAQYQPRELYNLGGLTFIPASWQTPTLALDINTLGVSRLLTAIRDHSPQTRFYQATSAKIFGIPRESPQTELTPLHPVDPYGVTKACAHYLVQNFRRHFNLFAVSGILYNHESERRGPEFVTRKITTTAVKIKLGQAKKLVLGDLAAEQDWGYAPDYVQAMWLMLQQDKPKDYIIATGESHSVREACEIAFNALALDYRDYVETDQKLIRHQESCRLIGNYHQAKQELGWQPKVSFKAMIIKMVQNDLKLLI